MMLDKNQIWAVFLFEFKMGCKSSRDNLQHQQCICPELIIYSVVMVQKVLQRRQEPGRWGAQWPASRSWQLPTERITEADLFIAIWEIAEELNINRSVVVGIWSKLERWKSSISVCHMLLLLLSHFSRVRLYVTPQTAAHQAPLSLGFSRQEHWSGLPFPSPVHESEKWKWSRSVVSDSSDPMDCSLPGSSVHGIF